MSRREDISLVCPDCRGPLEQGPEVASCAGCGRGFDERSGSMAILPEQYLEPAVLDLGSKFHGRAASLGGWRRRLFELLYVSPIRFIGDRQGSHGKNAHQLLLDFAGGGQRVLDLGSGNRRLLPHIVTADLVPGSEIDFVVDAHRTPFSSDYWDRVILQHVLEHVSEPRLVMAEVLRILKPGGLAYVEVPFLFPIHDRIDLRRWTRTGLIAEMAPLVPTNSGVTIGPFSAAVVVIRSLVTHRVANSYLATLLDLVLGWLFWPFVWLDVVFVVRAESQILAGAVYVIAVKRSDGQAGSMVG